VQGSLRMHDDGITVLTSSYNPYSFSTEGMSKSDGQGYKVLKCCSRMYMHGMHIRCARNRW
jgi:hypothetical protein